MSLLLDHGHPQARSYPLGMVFDEARLVAERLDRLSGGQAILTQMAVSSVPSMGVKPESTKSVGERFRTLVTRLIDGDR